MNTSRLKAIPTLYAGVQMRSKLEAEAAKLFDGLGIKWKYEPQGWDCDGVWYLPDFYLPAIRTYVEIKGVFDGDAERKAVALAWAANGLRRKKEVKLRVVDDPREFVVHEDAFPGGSWQDFVDGEGQDFAVVDCNEAPPYRPPLYTAEEYREAGHV